MKQKDWRKPSREALFVSEIATISLLGRKEDLEYLERLLDEAPHEELKRQLIELADVIRNRHSMGMRKDCCEMCEKFDDCELKWLKSERSMRPTCCPRCQFFQDCLDKFEREKPQKKKKTDPPES